MVVGVVQKIISLFSFNWRWRSLAKLISFENTFPWKGINFEKETRISERWNKIKKDCFSVSSSSQISGIILRFFVYFFYSSEEYFMFFLNNVIQLQNQIKTRRSKVIQGANANCHWNIYTVGIFLSFVAPIVTFVDAQTQKDYTQYKKQKIVRQSRYQMMQFFSK